jgi:hypothetical protein
MIQCNCGGRRIAIAIIIAVDVVREKVPSDRLSWMFVGRAGDQLVTGSFLCGTELFIGYKRGLRLYIYIFAFYLLMALSRAVCSTECGMELPLRGESSYQIERAAGTRKLTLRYQIDNDGR